RHPAARAAPRYASQARPIRPHRRRRGQVLPVHPHRGVRPVLRAVPLVSGALHQPPPTNWTISITSSSHSISSENRARGTICPLRSTATRRGSCPRLSKSDCTVIFGSFVQISP